MTSEGGVRRRGGSRKRSWGERMGVVGVGLER